MDTYLFYHIFYLKIQVQILESVATYKLSRNRFFYNWREII